MRNCTFIILITIMLLPSMHCNAQKIQKADSGILSKVDAFVGVGVAPLAYAYGTLGISIGKESRSPVYFTAKMQVGLFAIENLYYAPSLEMNFKIKPITFKNESSLNFEIPIWANSRNHFEWMAEERHPWHDDTWLQVGSGIDIRYDFFQCFSIFTRIGYGYGPKYNYAADFGFKNYQFVEYTGVPNLDLSFIYRFY